MSGRKLGHIVSTETRLKISLAQKGKKKKPMTAEHRKNLSLARKGTKLTDAWKEKIRSAHIGKIKVWVRGANHPTWKGETASVSSIHQWVKRNKPKPSHCENCKEQKMLELSSINHAYTRDVDEYRYLCRKCHRKWDVEHNNYNNLHR